ncbi:MAG: ATP-dependent DNA helicase RecQ [Bacteroidales bacterium]
MEQAIRKILLRNWGYHTFRPLQEDIILSVLEGRDTLALLPTGGGKSICFQVPALAKEGLCLVITPLIALMKDQVENLKKKEIKAAAIYSGMHPSEIETTLDNATYGDLKFLYISPERLETDTFRERLKILNVSLLAVDEAHCISQWGYDFRPPYLNIARARDFFPSVPILALTATATPEVVEDIQAKLEFREENAFQKSFERKNLAYIVIRDEDKYGRILKIAEKIKGTGIIYVRNRKKTREVAEYLRNNNISADFYHAGLSAGLREKKQEEWIDGKTRVMVSTNAFGMGIDKPDVRFVLHIDLPDSLEAYFQEAGRAGRDEKPAWATLIYDQSDIVRARKNYQNSFPDPKTIRSIYNSLGNYFQLAAGSGKDLSFDFDITEFAGTYRFSPIIVFNAMKFLEKEGYLLLNETFNAPSRLHFLLEHNDLYRFQVENPRYDGFIKLLLRLYPGLFTDFVRISEQEIANRGNTTKETIVRVLETLNKMGVLSYLPAKTGPQLTFLKERLDLKHLHISQEHYEARKKSALIRLDSVIGYVTTPGKCRSQILLEYFGEKDPPRCGQCDVCRTINKLNINGIEFDEIRRQVLTLISANPLTIQEITFEADAWTEDKVVRVIRWLEDSGRIKRNDAQQFMLANQFRLFL